MKIASIETFMVPPRWLFVRVGTDEGPAGWGEPVVEGRAATVRTAVEELAGYLIGRDPLLIEDHWQAMTRGTYYRGGPILSSAVGGIDQALWDIAGKVHGVPVHALLGGQVRDAARVYSWIGGDEPAGLREAASAQVAAGFTAVKMNASGRLRPIETPAECAAVVERVAAVRDVLGAERDIAVNFHGRVSRPLARRLLALLEPLSPLFVEEPLAPEHTQYLDRVVAGSSIPIATGERLYSRWDFRGPLEAGVAVAQPDISHAGGISEVRRIGALAETYGAFLAPHCALGPIALAASLQIAFAVPNFLIQEMSLAIHYNEGVDPLGYLANPEVLQAVDGMIRRLAGPGLGIEVDEDAVRSAAELEHNWHSPVWRHVDGSYAEW